MVADIGVLHLNTRAVPLYATLYRQEAEFTAFCKIRLYFAVNFAATVYTVQLFL